ncbi:beta-ketoacyl-[acyl-carrier-protein] synthase family protein [Nocardia sp. IBHARD005]|uniref:beta-ketoacyl-[acyl-carrier-protein] synthase family protein n=1 Tax=Nocardia sp. IBHARD005 TaxID=3457765 RepID=UPI0040599D9B
MTERRVVVTGLGLITALGEGWARTWEAIVEGKTAIGPLRGYDPAPLRTRLGAEITGFDPTHFVSRRSLRMANRGDQFAIAAATLALEDAGLADTELGYRTGLFLGGNKQVARLEPFTKIAGLRTPDGELSLRSIGEGVSRFISPLMYVEALQPAGVFHVSQKFGMRGPNAFFAGTAESGITGIGRGMRAIRRGEADQVVAGGYDDAVTWWSMSKMDGLGVLSPRNDLCERAFRPFDRDHSGSVLGEGGAVLVLEEREHALRRGARCYAEVTGMGSGNDGTRLAAPHPRGRGLARAIGRALTDAAGQGAPDYIAAHGCATPKGDISEARALHDALGDDAYRAQISSVKPQTGHLVGGAGALNVAVAALALDTGVVPATPNLETPAAGCDLDWIPGSARESRPGTALALARGLHGQAVAVALRKAS